MARGHRLQMRVLLLALVAGAVVASAGFAASDGGAGAGGRAREASGSRPVRFETTRSGAGAGPALVYSTFALSASSDEQRMAIGKDGSTYVAVGAGNGGLCGEPRTEGTFDTCAGQPPGGINGRLSDVLVAKYDPSGSKLVWATWLGGSSNEYPVGIGVDPAGNVYVVGFTHSKNFPTTAGALDRRKDGPTDAFITKFDPTGSTLLYSTFLGGTNGDVIHGLAVDHAGNLYIAGITASTDFPTTPGALARRRLDKHNADAFVAKLDPSGSRFLYSTLLGGNAYDGVAALEIDRAGNAYLTGETESTNFPTTRGAPQRRCATCLPRKGGYDPDGFLAKLDPSGSRLRYATFLGGHGVDNPQDLAVDRAGNAYVAGSTSSLDFPTTRGSFGTSKNDGEVAWSDGFVAKLNPAGTRFAYATYLGSRCACQELATAIAVDRAGNAWVAGWTGSQTFPTTKGAFRRRWPPSPQQVPSAGAFLTKLNRSGSSLAYSTFLGNAAAFDVGLDPRGNIYVAGSFAKNDFPTTPGAYRTAAKERSLISDGGFLMKFSAGR